MSNAFEKRKKILDSLKTYRKGRVPICFFNFDRESVPPGLPGVSTMFAADTKEVLYRILKESDCSKGIDLILYTRGGSTNAVWPLISLIREFDVKFEVLVPYRCHSSGTLLALGATKICMTKIAELSPIDPTTTNLFNPIDESNKNSRKPISVEDVTAYFNLIKERADKGESFSKFAALTEKIHPLALGNVQRAYTQTRQLAEKLLLTNCCTDEQNREKAKRIVEQLSTKFYSHHHSIPREEAKEVLGSDQVQFADNGLEELLDNLLRCYEDEYNLRKKFILDNELKDEIITKIEIVGAIIESTCRSYIFVTKGNWIQSSAPPPGMNINIPAGAQLPLFPGMPRNRNFQIDFQDWIHNGENK